MELTTLLQKNFPLLGKAIAKRVIEKSLPPLNMMGLFLTEAYNLRCDYCFVATKKAHKHMIWEVAKRAVDFLMEESRAEKELTITFFNGEPLLAFTLMKQVAEYAIQRANSLGKKVSFTCTTNATLLTEEHILFAQQHGFRYLLSIDGVKEVHDKYRVKANGQGSFDDIVKRLPMLKQLQGWLGTRMTFNPDTVHRLSESVQALFEWASINSSSASTPMSLGAKRQ
ncbi:MAG: radical SAM protein [Armatimonadetes bacterium]|nr:radical SAM protein [Armatimonadota bacterium]MCX7967869.1 radical SAM protein [Armatimonadota bacterium]MDW8142486.1 radical SAM protein [Armatimonadota bacterium]